jgi:hypothetical protein
MGQSYLLSLSWVVSVLGTFHACSGVNCKPHLSIYVFSNNYFAASEIRQSQIKQKAEL